ncbi:hypothetical protein MNEG_10639 [Monoraphidium neglectum]|uniref:Importin N-terminal domain-containing protein n=1 Tax=Monoraphidium neglectum TaxID=145388 RepID=A0A0D2KNU5_9CHLO|nr:hypothetical protein MNEG_10639 [Monoraphidium neglectum]KIY97323.1 hypothetical protein MNEG_10639 [Monoraphidium neglectum]|eukprot:XP_013896343.1 hypothetical protein MNEG_10639 [Monoraphidium neglectum]
MRAAQVHLYTATLASRLTQQRLANNIKSKADLPGKPVETWTSYQGLLRKYSIDAAGLPCTALALVLDAPVVSFLVATMNEQCDLFSVGEPFETFDLAIGFSPDAPDALTANISRVIVKLQTEQGLLDKLENSYITGAHGSGSCASTSPTSGNHGGGNTVVHIVQVAGLWYILAATILIGLFITSASVAQRWRSGAARASWHEAVSDSLAPGEQFAVKTPKASFWGTTLSFKPRPSAGPASRGEQEPRSPLSPVHRNSMLSRFATSASAGKHDAAAAATAASGGAEEATTQSVEQRTEAERMLGGLSSSTEFIPHCRVILDNSRSNYAQLLAAQTLLKLVNENTLTGSVRVDMKNYLFQYLSRWD